MRRVRNPRDRREEPVRESQIINNFITSAPGLPLAKCGGGIMKECINMEIHSDYLELRNPMYSRDSINDYSFVNVISIYGIRLLAIGASEDEIYYLATLSTNPSTEVYLVRSLFANGDYIASPVQYEYVRIDTAKIINFFGNKKILTNFTHNYNDVISRVLLGQEFRPLGLERPDGEIYISGQRVGGMLVLGETHWAKIAVGLEWVVKENDIVIRSSGIRRIQTSGGFFINWRNGSINPNATHLRIWASDFYDYFDSENQKAYEGNPDIMYMIREVPVSGIEFNEGIYQPSIDMHTFDFKPSLLSDEVTVNEEGDPLPMINLIPMENALCYSGNRLWGVLEQSKLIWSVLSGVPEQEQRKPLAVGDLNLGTIKSIESLNDDLYIFCEKGIAKITNSNPEYPPQTISYIGGREIKTYSVNGFGVFALIDGTLYFLDKDTQSFSKNCKGLDLNYYLGELTKGASQNQFVVDGNNLYFIMSNRLFMLNLNSNCGISEIVMQGNSYPIDITYNVETKSLLSLWQNREDNTLALWSNKESSQFTIEERELPYSATFALSAMHGWIEHLDTAVYAQLHGNSIIGTQNTCDDVPYNNAVSLHSPAAAADIPYEYQIVAGKRAGVKRPIGKAIAIKLSITGGNQSPSETPQQIYQIDLTTQKQLKVFRKNFNPNRENTEYLITDAPEIILHTPVRG